MNKKIRFLAKKGYITKPLKLNISALVFPHFFMIQKKECKKLFFLFGKMLLQI